MFSQTLPCFLHKLTTIIGKISAYPTMKPVISQTAQIVSFFDGSHYWGGQLDQEARLMNINHTMKTHTESRWYSLILQGLSVTNYQ